MSESVHIFSVNNEAFLTSVYSDPSFEQTSSQIKLIKDMCVRMLGAIDLILRNDLSWDICMDGILNV